MLKAYWNDDERAIEIKAPERALKPILQFLSFSREIDRTLAGSIIISVQAGRIYFARVDRIRIALAYVEGNLPDDIPDMMLSLDDIKVLNRALGSLKRKASWTIKTGGVLPVWEQQTGKELTSVPLHACDADWISALEAYREDPLAAFSIKLPADLVRKAVRDDQQAKLLFKIDNSVADLGMTAAGQLVWSDSTAIVGNKRNRKRTGVYLKHLSIPISDEQDIEIVLTNDGPIGFDMPNRSLWLMPINFTA